jgi:hypothetical protein
MSNDTELEEMRRELEKILKKNRDAFKGAYKDEINQLLSISREDIDAIVPGTEDMATYDALIEVVKEASRKNHSQAQLKARIEELGEIALKIASKIPNLAALFV